MASSTNPEKVQTLLDKLKKLAENESKMLSGDTTHEFFIEAYNKSSLKELLKDFEPDDANSIWDAERQKKFPDADTLMKARRAVAFMAAGKAGLHRRYAETELTACVMGRSYLQHDKYMLGEAKYAMTLNSHK